MNRKTAVKPLFLVLFSCGVLLMARAATAKPAFSTTTTAISMSHSATADMTSDGSMIIRNYATSGKYYSGAFYVAFSQTSLTRGTGDALSYELLGVNGGTESVLACQSTPTQSSQVLSGSFTSSTAAQTSNFVYRIRVKCGTLPSSGTFTLKIRASLYAATFTSGVTPTVIATKTITVTIKVYQFVSVSVAGTNGVYSSSRATIAFNEIAENASLSGSIAVVSNIKYYIRLKSAKGSILTNATYSDTIPYTITYTNGSTTKNVDLGGVSPMISAGAKTFSAGKVYTINIIIGSFTTLPPPADYEDTVTITISAS